MSHLLIHRRVTYELVDSGLGHDPRVPHFFGYSQNAALGNILVFQISRVKAEVHPKSYHLVGQAKRFPNEPSWVTLNRDTQ